MRRTHRTSQVRRSVADRHAPRAARLVRSAVDSLEPRRLLSGLADLRGSNGFVQIDRPTNAVANAAQAVHAVAQTDVVAVDADLLYLANHLSDADLARVDRFEPALQTLIGRDMRNGEAPLDIAGQSINGTPYSHIYNVLNGMPHLDVYVDNVTNALPLLRGAGMIVSATFAEGMWQLVGGFVPTGKLLDVARVPGVKFAAPSTVTETDSEGGLEAMGNNINEWEALTRADVWKAIFPTEDGSGINVGVISDSFNLVSGGLTQSVNNGDLPNTVTNLQDAASGIDEGRAMLELIYDVADGAGLFFHSAYGVSGHAAAYTNLRAAGVDVIADDIPNLNEPVFQQGPISTSAEATYNNFDVLVFGSAGNRNGEGLAEPWTNTDADDFHEFGGSGDDTLEITLNNGEDQDVILHWNQPWGAATTDIDIGVWVRNADGSVGAFVGESNFNNVGNNPRETFSFTNTSGATRSYHIAFRRESGVANGLQLQAYFADFDSEVTFLDNKTQNEPALNANRNSDNTFAIGAVPWTNPGTIEGFSSRGPHTRYFTDAGAAYATPVLLQLPQFTASDGNATGTTGFANFFGTSAAAPNAAAVAALVLDRAGNVGRGDLTFGNLRSIFQDTAVGTNAGLAWDDAHGFGRIDALGAGFAVKGSSFDELAIELNPFGDGEVSSNLGSQTDVDGAYFAVDSSGTTTINGVDITNALDPALALYRRDIAGYAGFVDFDDDSGTGDDALISSSLGFWTMYNAELLNQTLNNTLSNYTISVNGPTATITPIALDANADYSSTTENLGSVGDADYYSFTLPSTSNGTMDITATPSAATPTLNVVLTVYDAAGNQIARRSAAGDGAAETASLTGLTPGVTYYVRVGSLSYASLGDFALSLNGGTFVPATFLAADAEGMAVFSRNGISADASSGIDPFMDFADDVDSMVFAGDTGWTGNYVLSFTGTGSVRPVVAVYNGDTGALIASNFNVLNQPTVSLTLVGGAALQRYVVAVADRAGTATGDITYTITAPSSATGAILAADNYGRDDSSIAISPQEDTDFYTFAVPNGVTSSSLRLLPGSDTFLGTLAVFDAAGALVSVASSFAAGGVVPLTATGLVAGQTYSVSVASYKHGVTGSPRLLLQHNLPVGTATGLKYEDVNGNGARDVGDPLLSGWTVWTDLDNDGGIDTLPAYANDADYYATDSVISSSNPRVTLTAQGTDVTNSSVTARATTFTPPSTGLRAFGNNWTTLGADGQVWRQGFAELRATFNTAYVSSVSIDATQNVIGNTSRMVAYNAADVAIATVNTPVSTVGDETQTLTITRAQADIAYVVVFGVGNSANGLDNLRWQVSEPTAITGVGGAYSMGSIPAGTRTVREVQQAGWGQSQPGGSLTYSASITSGGTTANLDFGNYRVSTISGTKWDDVNRNGSIDGGDSVLAGIRIYVDSNNNSVFDAGEPNAITNGAGAYSITGLAPQTARLREVVPTSYEVVLPAGNLYTITLTSNSSFTRNFLNRRLVDFGDAPAPYLTTFASGGAYHWTSSTFFLGASVDSEVDGTPSANANADDSTGADDENGVTFLDPIIPGAVTRIQVTVSANGRLQGWIDLNRDGDWNDAVDVAINNVLTGGAGTFVYNVAIPVIANLGASFARFRFSANGGLTPNGLGFEGEVEDYRVTIGDTTPPAVLGAGVEWKEFQGFSVKFDEPLAPGSVQASDLLASNLSTGGPAVAATNVTIEPGGDVLTFRFAPGALLPDGNYRFDMPASAVTDLAGNPAVAYSYSGLPDSFFYRADYNRDKLVNFDDLLILAANYNQVGKNATEGDTNYDGTVNFDDLLVLAARYNQPLLGGPAPLLASGPGGGAPATDAGSDDEEAGNDVLA